MNTQPVPPLREPALFSGKAMFEFLRRYVPVYQPSMVILVAILYLTLLPDPLGEDELPLFYGADKVAHFIMFGALTGAIIFDMSRDKCRVTIVRALLVAALCSIIGITVEFLQSWMQMGRSGNDIADAVANCAGTLVAIPISMMLGWIDCKKSAATHTGSTS